GGRRDADGAGAGGAEIRQDVAEQVGRYDDVEPVGMRDEVRGQDIDVELVPADVGILLGHRLDALVPVRHRDRDAVRLGRGGQSLLRPLSGQFECEFQNPINSLSGKARLLKYDFAFSPFVHAAATLEYSPSVFSRTTKKSMSPGLRSASGVRMPGMRRQGRRLTYWSNSRRNLISMPHSET